MLDARSADSAIVAPSGIISGGEIPAVTRAAAAGATGFSTGVESIPMTVAAFTSEAVWAALPIVIVGACERLTAEPGIALGIKFAGPEPAAVRVAFSSPANSPAVAGLS